MSFGQPYQDRAGLAHAPAIDLEDGDLTHLIGRGTPGRVAGLTAGEVDTHRLPIEARAIEEQRDLEWPKLEAVYRQRGITVCRYPIADFSPSDVRKKLRASVRLVDDLIRAGHVVYLHCNAGINRSPTVAVAYLHWAEGWDLRAAYEHMMACRPCDPYVQEIMLAPPDSEVHLNA